MVAQLADLVGLPDWPRLLSREQAAAYCGMSPPSFNEHVKVKPLSFGRRRLYDRRDLDAWIDSRRETRTGVDWLAAYDDHHAPSGN